MDCYFPPKKMPHNLEFDTESNKQPLESQRATSKVLGVLKILIASYTVSTNLFRFKKPQQNIYEKSYTKSKTMKQ